MMNSGIPNNHGKPWTREEDGLLRRRYDSGATVEELANMHGRSAAAIAFRLVSLGYTNIDISRYHRGTSQPARTYVAGSGSGGKSKVMTVLNVIFILGFFSMFGLLILLSMDSPDDFDEGAMGMLLGGAFVFAFVIIVANHIADGIKRTRGNNTRPVTRKCVSCGHNVDVNTGTCPMCRARSGTSDTKRCVSCGHTLEAAARSCPRCHTLQPGTSSGVKRCTSCGHTINADAKSCPRCYVVQPYSSSGRRR